MKRYLRGLVVLFLGALATLAERISLVLAVKADVDIRSSDSGIGADAGDCGGGDGGGGGSD
jgi:hypothetical protein